MKILRTLISTLLLGAALTAAFPALAQQPLPKLEPLPDIAPPRMPIDPSLEPQITIRQRDGDKIEEFRVRGKLYMVRVTPPNGRPYVLVDHQGDGQFAQPTQGPADAHGLSVPMWVIGTF